MYKVVSAILQQISFGASYKTIYMKNPLAPKRITEITGLIAFILGIIEYCTLALILAEHN
jgi:hypothetical protein